MLLDSVFPLLSPLLFASSFEQCQTRVEQNSPKDHKCGEKNRKRASKERQRRGEKTSEADQRMGEGWSKSSEKEREREGKWEIYTCWWILKRTSYPRHFYPSPPFSSFFPAPSLVRSFFLAFQLLPRRASSSPYAAFDFYPTCSFDSIFSLHLFFPRKFNTISM